MNSKPVSASEFAKIYTEVTGEPAEADPLPAETTRRILNTHAGEKFATALMAMFQYVHFFFPRHSFSSHTDNERLLHLPDTSTRWNLLPTLTVLAMSRRIRPTKISGSKLPLPLNSSRGLVGELLLLPRLDLALIVVSILSVQWGKLSSTVIRFNPSRIESKRTIPKTRISV